ncbi:unnamed protein product [marine sediment metagenome]|uniref:Ribbon-helix-helix protein CopG domain-containing protein n=1 Tax=marine sediment metagenome TaxID=412755 RepID=X1SNF7_9ZZZZ
MKEVITIRMGTEDKKRVEAEAKKLGLSVSAFIRLLIKQWSNGIKFEKRED